jgi:cellulose synthase/poly-beta-1,6-N-acetylglucosamine synthase-like glycosyltransferase
MAALSPVTFSVVIPTYNRADVLPRAIASVLAQTLTPLDVIVVDDGSTDDTLAIVEAMADARIHTLRLDHAGAVHARNQAARIARGNVLAFLDDDDEADPEWLATMAQPFADDAAVALVSCPLIYLGCDGTFLKVQQPLDYGPAFDHRRAMFLAGGYAVRRDAFETTGGFAEGLVHGEHTELGMRLVGALDKYRWQSATVAEPLVTVNMRPTGAERSSVLPRHQYESAMYVLEHHQARLARDPVMLANYLAVAGVAATRLGRNDRARSLLARAVRADPRRPKHYARLILALVPPLGRRVWSTDQPS